ncbi:hypothetical protein Efla_005208 [Eimeria flavescens]
MASSDNRSGSIDLGLSAGLGSLAPPGAPSLSSSSSSSSSRWGPQVALHPAAGRDELYLYTYGKQFGEKLTYSAGRVASGAIGLALGGGYGFLSGLKRGGETPRLRLNSVLNGCSMHAPRLGSEFAALSLFYCCFNNALILMRGESEMHAPIAGALAGCLYRCRASWRLFATYGVASSVAFTAIDQYMRRYL